MKHYFMPIEHGEIQGGMMKDKLKILMVEILGYSLFVLGLLLVAIYLSLVLDFYLGN